MLNPLLVDFSFKIFKQCNTIFKEYNSVVFTYTTINVKYIYITARTMLLLVFIE